MGSLDGLGALFNLVPLANSVHVKVTGAGVTFIAYASGGIDTLTLNEGIDGGTARALAAIRDVWKGPPGAGGPWTKIEQTAASTFTHTDTTNTVVFTHIYAAQLTSGYNTLAMTAELSSVEQWCQAIPTDLFLARTPDRLTASV